MARKSGSRKRNGIFDTCNRFGWFLESEDEMVAIVVTAVDIGAIVANADDAAAAAAAAAAAPADVGKLAPPTDVTVAIMLASNACWAAATAA